MTYIKTGIWTMISDHLPDPTHSSLDHTALGDVVLVLTGMSCARAADAMPTPTSQMRISLRADRVPHAQ